MSSKIWTDHWEIVRKLGSGGHGSAQLAAEKRTGNQGVLKLLIENEKQERRDRLHNEALALQILDHPRLPKLIDHNVEHRTEKAVELYIVTEFIPGQEMSRLPSAAPLPDALTCVEAILDAVQYCHARDIRHRDLKPTNVILRNNNICDPVVIDFGQSFNEHEAAIMPTDVGDGLGNRCMHLPELQPGSENKRSKLTDLSFCAGILFWLLTKHCPRELGQDHNNKYPYEREPAASIINGFSSPVRRQVLRFFTMGLARGFEQRILSVESFREKLAAIRNPEQFEANESIADSIAQAVADVEKDAGYMREKRAVALREALWDAVVLFAQELKKALGPKINAPPRRPGPDQTGVFYTDIVLQHLELARTGVMRITGEVQGDHFLIGCSVSPLKKPPIVDQIEIWDSEFKSLINRIVQRVGSDILKVWLLNKET